MFLPEGNFDIDAGDGGGGDHLGPKIPNMSKNHQQTIIFYIFPPEGNFDIDARDGGTQTPPNISKVSPKTLKRKQYQKYIFKMYIF